MEFLKREIDLLFDRIESDAKGMYGEFNLSELEKKHKAITDTILSHQGFDKAKHQHEFYFLEACNQTCKALFAYDRGDYETALKSLCQGNFSWGGFGADLTFKEESGGKGGRKAHAEDKSCEDFAIKYYLAHREDVGFLFRNGKPNKTKIVEFISARVVDAKSETVKKWLSPKNLRKKGIEY